MSEVIRPDIKEAPVISTDVFNAFKKGNMMWPQYSFGIKVFTANAFLREDQPNWKEFAESKLSREQEAELAQLMADAHHQYAVPIAMKGYTEPGDKTPPDDRIARLWKSAKSFVFADLINLIDGEMNWDWNGDYTSPITLTDPKITQISTFFSVPENAERLRIVSRTASEIEDFLLEKPQLERSNKHRQKVIAAHHRSQKPSFSYPDMKQDILKFLDEKMPGEDFDWVVWGV